MRSVLPPIAALVPFWPWEMIVGPRELRESRISVSRVGLFESFGPSSFTCPAVLMAGSSDNNRTWDVQSEDAKRLLAEDKYDDCLSCRVTGELIL